MTREGIIAFLRGNFYKRVRHRFFAPGEYVYCAEDGNIYDENGYLFENWDEGSLTNNGLRMRSGGRWEDGWEIVDYQRNERLADNYHKCAAHYAPKIAFSFYKKQSRIWRFKHEHIMTYKQQRLINTLNADYMVRLLTGKQSPLLRKSLCKRFDTPST